MSFDYQGWLEEEYERLAVMKLLGVNYWTSRCLKVWSFREFEGVLVRDLGIVSGWEGTLFNPKRSMNIGWDRVGLRRYVPVIVYVVEDRAGGLVLETMVEPSGERIPF